MSMLVEWNREVTYILWKVFHSCNAVSAVQTKCCPSGREKFVMTADL